MAEGRLALGHWDSSYRSSQGRILAPPLLGFSASKETPAWAVEAELKWPAEKVGEPSLGKILSLLRIQCTLLKGGVFLVAKGPQLFQVGLALVGRGLARGWPRTLRCDDAP